IDKYVLFAPFIAHDAPTTRPNSGGWAHVAIRRIIGLSMLNNVGITAFNDLSIISFAMPQSVLDGPLGHTATLNYSYRLNTSYSPRRNYHADIAAMTQPFLLLVGEDDEAFHAGVYETVMSPLTKSGSFILLGGVNHLGIMIDDQTIVELTKWL
ncbi:MAG: hypothetical protein JKY99_07275, partial [Rhizobiales bacterium]|nr:hypothetical protein [Hyphomicrobiales bacterium]